MTPPPMVWVAVTARGTSADHGPSLCLCLRRTCTSMSHDNSTECRNIGAEREQTVLNALEAAYHPYVRDRGLDWEIHIEQVNCQMLS